ncbi:MAG TPA: 3-deoxy-D-manno-octulosonic acid transferase [Sedimentisphaerales bacterium]|nr:3-deoxy-D-manno-octulosonic acid transferase [Sedimentisphaerales bacterium]
MRFAVDLLYLLAAAAYSPVVVYRAVRHKRYRTGWDQRFGKITRRSPTKKCIWLHAVSVGEVNAAKTIVKELENKFGDFEIVISTTTDTGFARATNLFSENHQVFYFPFDFSRTMRRAFSNIRPAICLLMELEVWPNFVQIAEQSNIPIVVVNGRISDRSFTSYKRVRPLIRKMFGRVPLVLAQTDEYARRFKEIGCPDEKVIVTGSLKYDTAQITNKIEGADVLASQLNINDERLWVAGATGNDEEKILLDVYQNLKQQSQFSDLRLAIVPRKPERFDEVAQLIESRGLSLVRYSHIKKLTTENIEKSIINNQSSIDTVILGDTMGDLRKFYSLATIIFVGRSLVPMGGSDMAEAAALGKCTIFGPHAFNFKQTVDALLADTGAIMVKDKEELLQTMQKCFSDADFAQSIAKNGQEVIRKNQGATAKTIDQIAKFLNTTR